MVIWYLHRGWSKREKLITSFYDENIYILWNIFVLFWFYVQNIIHLKNRKMKKVVARLKVKIFNWWCINENWLKCSFLLRFNHEIQQSIDFPLILATAYPLLHIVYEPSFNTFQRTFTACYSLTTMSCWKFCFISFPIEKSLAQTFLYVVIKETHDVYYNAPVKLLKK